MGKQWWLGKKPFSKPAGEAYRKGWDAVFGGDDQATVCEVSAELRSLGIEPHEVKVTADAVTFSFRRGQTWYAGHVDRSVIADEHLPTAVRVAARKALKEEAADASEQAR